jgi:ribose-phosphate pyrophosphokinase
MTAEEAMEPVLLSGSGNPPLAAAIGRELGLGLGKAIVERFPDDELHVEVLEDVRGRDVYVVQSLRPPAERTLLELLLVADASRRAGARSVIAAIPYLAYARQDSRVTGREPLGARVVADLLQVAGIDRVIVLDLHSPAAEACFGVPVEHLSAIPLLADELRATIGPGGVVVSPDLGGVARAEKYAKRLGLPSALVHKSRVSGAEVSVRGVIGEPRGCAPIVVDDMISTGATVDAAVRALQSAGCLDEITVAATHALLVAGAIERLARLPIRRLVTTDSVPLAGESPFPITRLSVAPMIASALARFTR